MLQQATSVTSQKSYKSIAIQTDNLIANCNTNSISKSLKNNGSQSEINTENSTRQVENTPNSPNIFNPVITKDQLVFLFPETADCTYSIERASSLFWVMAYNVSKEQHWGTQHYYPLIKSQRIY